MRGWRSKFIFILIVYFAGFATAIYFLAPTSDDNSDSALNLSGKDEILSKIKSEQFVKSINSGMHKCIDFGKDAATHTADYIKQKIDEKQNQTQD